MFTLYVLCISAIEGSIQGPVLASAIVLDMLDIILGYLLGKEKK